MAGLVPAIHVYVLGVLCKTWMPATRAGMTGQWVERLKGLCKNGKIFDLPPPQSAHEDDADRAAESITEIDLRLGQIEKAQARALLGEQLDRIGIEDMTDAPGRKDADEPDRDPLLDRSRMTPKRLATAFPRLTQPGAAGRGAASGGPRPRRRRGAA